MPIAKFNRCNLPAGFATKSQYFKIEQRADAVMLIDMTCPHRGGPLTHGACDGHQVICPWHKSRVSRSKLEQRTEPTIMNSNHVMFIVDDVARVFHEVPVDLDWSKPK